MALRMMNAGLRRKSRDLPQPGPRRPPDLYNSALTVSGGPRALREGKRPPPGNTVESRSLARMQRRKRSNEDGNDHNQYSGRHAGGRRK